MLLGIFAGLSAPALADPSSTEPAGYTDTLRLEEPTRTPTAPPSTELNTIVVTGSRIPRAEFESLQPTVVLDAERIDLRGAIDLATVLNEQASFAAPSTSPIDGADTSEPGQNYVDFLGLGQQRTLTLVNGQRFPAGVSPSGIGGLSVDLNLIPEQLIERVEIIAVGGAPVYGSDAIAGTVNLILKDDFEGLDVFASTGNSPEYGDFGRNRLGAIWGQALGRGRGNITLAGQYARNDGLKKTDRPGTDTLVGFERPGDPDSPFGRVLFDDLTVAADNGTAYPLYFGQRFNLNVFGNGISLDISDPTAPISQFDNSGNLLPFVPGGGTGSPIFRNGGDGLKLAGLSSLYNDIERTSANLFLNYALSQRLRLASELWAARTDAVRVVNQPFYNSPAFGGLPADNFGQVGEGPIPILIDNPFLTDASRAVIQAALDVVHDQDGDGQADPTIDTDGDGQPDAVGFWRGGALNQITGATANSTQRDLLRGLIGLSGDLDLGGRTHTWDATWTWGETQANNTRQEIIQPRFDQAIQVIRGADGAPACADPSGGCVPLDVIGTPSRAALDYTTAVVTDRAKVSQQVLSANIQGDLAHLPAGDWAGAVGISYRRESARFNPNELSATGQTRDPLVPIRGAFSSTELYGEMVLPLLDATAGYPLVERLQFEGALRWVDNSVAGTDTTWTAGLRYQMLPGLEWRGNRTVSIRAPSISELFTPESRINTFANDPCDSRFINQGSTPQTRAENCAADGIEQPFQSFIVNASQPATLSGNTDLDSEKARSSSFGVIWQPRAVAGLSLAADWIDISIANAIESLTATDILNACYDSDNFPAEASCGRFSRDADGQVNSMRTGFLNLGLLEFKGLQTVLGYTLDTRRLGRIDLSLNHLYTELLRETPGAGNADRLDGEIGRSKHRVTAGLGWKRGVWTVFNQVRWLDRAVFDNADGPLTRDVRGVSDWFVVDTSVGYALGRHNLRLQLNIDNLFDTAAPFPAVASADGETTYISGFLGRYAQLSLRASF